MVQKCSLGTTLCKYHLGFLILDLEGAQWLSGRVLDGDRGAPGSSLTGVIVLCSLARHINPSLVLVQPRKTSLYITERLLMGSKELNQTNKTNSWLRS